MWVNVAKSVLVVGLLATLSACGGFSLWPFGGGEGDVRHSGPAGSTPYLCDKGRKFYVKQVDAGKAAWLILPDREILLNKTDSGAYSNSITTLLLEGEGAKLDDGYKHDYNDCKINLPVNKS